jgi:hypothetical protein
VLSAGSALGSCLGRFHQQIAADRSYPDAQHRAPQPYGRCRRGHALISAALEVLFRIAMLVHSWRPERL